MTTQLQQDFDAYWASAKPGEVTKVGDLTYTMGTGGTATVTGPGGYSQTFTSTTNPAALATNKTVAQSYQQNYGSVPTPPGGMTALNRDLDAFKAQATPGFQTEAEGFNYNVADTGHINVTTPSGRSYRFLPGSTPETIANHIPELAASWNKRYGTNFNVQPMGPTYWGNFAPQMQIGGVALKDMPPDSPYVQRINDLYRSVYGSSPLEMYRENPTGNWMTGGTPFNANTVASFAPWRAAGTTPDTTGTPGWTPTADGPFTPGPVGGGSGGGGGTAPPGWQTGGTGGTPGAPTPGPGPAGGLLQQANLGEVATYNPFTSEVEYDELVKNQLAEAMDSPYAEVARKRALDEMNERGLLSSTLAEGAATRAAIEASLPIAQQDAATLTENRFRANETINRALSENTTARNQMTKANMDALNAFGLDAQQYNQQRDLTGIEHAQQMKLAEFDRDTRERLTAMTIGSEEFLQSQRLNQQDREFVIGAIADQNEYIMGAISNIQKIEGLSDDQRRQLMDELGATHYANLMVLQQLTGATINWNVFGPGGETVTEEPNATILPADGTTPTGFIPYQDESTYL